MINETDKYFRIDEDLKFFREVQYIKNNHSIERIKNKYQVVYNIYKNRTAEFFDKFEKEGFFPFVLNEAYSGSINPFNLLAEKEKTIS